VLYLGFKSCPPVT